MKPEQPDSKRPPTAERNYAERLHAREEARWKRLLNAQAPYRWNVRRLNLGRTLDVGCGLGRNLAHLDGNGVGVDHNPDSVAIARSRGLEAYTIPEFLESGHARPASFDSLLLAHVLEHMDLESDVKLLRDYLPYIKPGGVVCFITPQERGYASDATHVQFVDFEKQREIAEAVGISADKSYSFPFPRFIGKVFTYNEFVFVGRLAA